jgi:hypothetical protein
MYYHRIINFIKQDSSVVTSWEAKILFLLEVSISLRLLPPIQAKLDPRIRMCGVFDPRLLCIFTPDSIKPIQLIKYRNIK